MKVKYLQSMAGDRFVRVAGEEHEIPDTEAERLIVAGFVEKSKESTTEQEAKKPKGK